MKFIGKHVPVTAGRHGSELPTARGYHPLAANNELAFSLAYLSRQVIWVVPVSVRVESVSDVSVRGCGPLRK